MENKCKICGHSFYGSLCDQMVKNGYSHYSLSESYETFQIEEIYFISIDLIAKKTVIMESIIPSDVKFPAKTFAEIDYIIPLEKINSVKKINKLLAII